MFFVFRALVDPLFEEGDLVGGEGLVGLGGRHDFIRVVGGDAGDDFVPILVVGDVETEVGFADGLAVFALAVIGAVAFEAVGGEDGADVFREGEFFRILGSKNAPDGGCKEERWEFWKIEAHLVGELGPAGFPSQKTAVSYTISRASARFGTMTKIERSITGSLSRSKRVKRS